MAYVAFVLWQSSSKFTDVGLRFLSICLFCLACCLSSVKLYAAASETDTFKPYLSSSILYDSNYLRLSKSASPSITGGVNDFSEVLKQASAGFDVDWKISRQHILIKANINQNWFENFTSLDYLGWNNRAQWDWQVGNQLNGEIGYGNRKFLGTYNQLNAFIPNLSTTQEYFANAGYLFHPNARLKLGVFRTDSQFDSVSRATSNILEDNFEANLQYISPSSNIIGFRFLGTDGRYPQRQFIPTQILDTAYSRFNYQLTWDWRLDSKFRIDGNAGYTEQNFEHFRVQNFSSVVGQLNLHWQYSEKTLLELNLKREIGQALNVNSSFIQIQGVEFNARWQLSPKLVLQLPLSYQEQAFLGQSGASFANLPQQINQLTSVGLNLSYLSFNGFTINSLVSYENRDSNFSDRVYQSFSAGMNFKLVF
ncbi:MAG: outer membrane beta-barrel protein [Methylococcaceae bacterium]|jgi:exopolysaccharide biosynthesis operon protein EpsL